MAAYSILEVMVRTNQKFFKDYISKIERNLQASFLEHRKPISTSSTILRHMHDFSPGHDLSLENDKILYCESSFFEQEMK